MSVVGVEVQHAWPVQFQIPAPYRAWCHLCQGEETVAGIPGAGFMTLDELTEHDKKAHNRK